MNSSFWTQEQCNSRMHKWPFHQHTPHSTLYLILFYFIYCMHQLFSCFWLTVPLPPRLVALYTQGVDILNGQDKNSIGTWNWKTLAKAVAQCTVKLMFTGFCGCFLTNVLEMWLNFYIGRHDAGPFHHFDQDHQLHVIMVVAILASLLTAIPIKIIPTWLKQGWIMILLLMFFPSDCSLTYLKTGGKSEGWWRIAFQRFVYTYIYRQIEESWSYCLTPVFCVFLFEYIPKIVCHHVSCICITYMCPVINGSRFDNAIDASIWNL